MDVTLLVSTLVAAYSVYIVLKFEVVMFLWLIKFVVNLQMKTNHHEI